MTATVPWAALAVLTAAALLILFGNTLAARVRRRNVDQTERRHRRVMRRLARTRNHDHGGGQQ